MKNETLPNCTFVKTILMLLVILGHSVAFWSGNWFIGKPIVESVGLNYIFIWMSSFHTYTFVLVSGYIFAYKMCGGVYKDFAVFLKNKVKRLLIPYIFVAAIWVVPISEKFFCWDGAYLVQTYILCVNPSQLWFLWMLFEIFIIMWLLWKLVSYNPTLGIVIAICFYFIGIIGSRVFPNYFCIWRTCQYIPFFYIGIRIRQKEENKEKIIFYQIPSLLWIAFDLFLFIVHLVLMIQTGTLMKMIKIGISFLFHVVGAVMAFVVLQRAAFCINWRESKWFNWLVSHSMPMYLFHQQIIYFVIVWLNGKVNPYINACANFIIALVGSLVISNLLMKYKATRILIGE